MADDDDKFTYYNPRKGNRPEQRSVNPGFWEKTKEGVMDSADVDKQRAMVKAAKAARNTFDKSTTYRKHDDD